MWVRVLLLPPKQYGSRLIGRTPASEAENVGSSPACRAISAPFRYKPGLPRGVIIEISRASAVVA